jgi:hypothetical protein
MTTIIARSADAVHWYQQDGRPAYTVKAKDGSDRATTLRDARKFNLVPSVTTVLRIMAKPGLDIWKQEQMLLAALTLPRAPDESEKSFIARIVHDSKDTARQAADRGTRIHESIERWYKGDYDVAHINIAKSFEWEVMTHFNIPSSQKWRTEISFSSTMCYGGKIDLHLDPSDHAPRGIVLDAKTKAFGPGEDVVGYDEHLMQLAAYRQGLGLPNARCANVYASVSNPGLVKVMEWSEEELTRGWEMFQCLLKFWKLKNNFGV